jgi:alpha-1,2-mannosyltransferase
MGRELVELERLPSLYSGSADSPPRHEVSATRTIRLVVRPAVLWPVPLLVIALAGCAFMVQRTIESGRYTDFSMLHRSAVALGTGANLYDHGDPVQDGNLNPPHVAVLMLPLSRLPIESAAVAGWVVIALSMITVAALVRRALSPWWTLAVMAVALASPAGYLGVRFINLGWPLAVGVTLAWLAMREGRQTRAGLLIGVLATIKVFLLIFIPYFLWRRQWRALSAAILSAATTIAAGALVCGVDAYAQWIQQLDKVRWQSNTINISMLGYFQRTLDVSAPGGFAPLVDAPILVTPLWLLASLALIAVMHARFGCAADPDAEWGALLIAALLISPLGWSYYGAMAAGPVGAALVTRTRSWPERAGVVLSLTPFLVLTYGQPSAWLTATWASAYAAGALLLWLALVRGRRISRSSGGD